MSCGIIVCHGPADRQEAKQPTETDRLPTSGRFDMGEDIRGIVFVVRHDQKSNSTSHEDADVKDDIELGHLFHPVCRQRVN